MKVPVMESAGVRQAGLPDARQVGRGLDGFLDVGQQQALAATQNALGAVQHAALSMHLQALEDTNRLRVQDAENQLIQHDQDAAFGDNGWRRQTGAAVFTQQNSKPLTDNVLDSRQAKIDEIIKGLGNDYQRTLFKQRADQSGLSLRGHLMNHENEQGRVYKRGVLVQGLDTAERQMSLFYNDGAQVQAALDNIQQFSVDLGELEHGSQEIGQVAAKQRASSAINSAIQAALQQQDHASATRLLQQFSGHMEASDMLKAAKLITEEQDNTTAMQISKTVIGELYPRMVTPEGDRAINILAMAESGNRQFSETGQPITSPKGAIGKMQVMESTGPEAAKLAGLPWNPALFRRAKTGNAQQDQETEQYNQALGTAYFKKQLQDFNGDLALAYAAYNAGPGATRKALKQAGAQWLSALPEETQAYVSQNLKAYASGAGQYAKPTLRDAQQTALSQLGPASAELQQKTLRLVEQRYQDELKAQKEREDDATAQAMQYIYTNKVAFEALPAELSAQVPIDKKMAVTEFAKKVTTGEDLHDPAAWADVVSMTPQALSQMTPQQFVAAFRDKLDDSHLDKGLAMIKEASTRGDTNAHLEVISTQKRLQSAAIKAGILQEDGKAKNNDALLQYRQFETLVDERVREFESTLGQQRKATTEELQQVIDGVLVDQVFDSGGLFGFETQKPVALLDEQSIDRAFVKVGREEIKLSAIPADQRSLIISKLEQRGRQATEQAIAELWVAAGKPR
jgi:soluble lytic murein transglycosylase